MDFEFGVLNFGVRTLPSLPRRSAGRRHVRTALCFRIRGSASSSLSSNLLRSASLAFNLLTSDRLLTTGFGVEGLGLRVYRGTSRIRTHPPPRTTMHPRHTNTVVAFSYGRSSLVALDTRRASGRRSLERSPLTVSPTVSPIGWGDGVSGKLGRPSPR